MADKDPSRRIMTIIASEPIRTALSTGLQEAGYTVEEKQDALEALGFIAENAPALVVFESGLPGIHERDFLHRLRALPGSGGMAILQISAHPAHPQTRIGALNDGADVYLAEAEPAEIVAYAAALLRRSIALRQPACPPPAEPPALSPTAMPKKEAGPPLILLVEDYAPNILVASCLLDALDVRYDVVHNGQEALDKTSAQPYDLILMDVQMPVMDGLTATQRLREREKGGHATPIIGITAYALSGDKEKCLAAGMNDYISKPFNTVELKGKILTLLAATPPRPSI